MGVNGGKCIVLVSITTSRMSMGREGMREVVQVSPHPISALTSPIGEVAVVQAAASYKCG